MAAERRGWSVRARVTAGGSLVVLLALGIGAAGFVAALERTLMDSASAEANRQADHLAEAIEASGIAEIPDNQDDEGDALLQLQRDGRVVAAGEDADDTVLPVSDRAVRIVVDDDAYLARSEDLTIGGERYVVVVARSLEVVEQAQRVATGLLIAAVPVLTMLVGLLIWALAGRALAPVERARSEVEAIGAGELERRLSRPGTGDEVDRLIGTLNGLLDRLDSAQRTQRRFVSDASHELRSPVATLRQHAELARRHPEATDAGVLAEVVEAESARLEELVGSLIFLARMDEGVEAEFGEVDLDDLALAEIDRLRGLGRIASAAGIAPARVHGDAPALARALRNLVDNAVRHAERTVAISTSIEAADAVLRVDDDGPGIPADDRATVFERFVRLDDGRARDAGGSGLGLAIVAEVAHRHGGTATVGRSPLGGARVEIRLPVHLS